MRPISAVQLTGMLQGSTTRSRPTKIVQDDPGKIWQH